MADTEKKPGFMARIKRSIRDMRGEVKRVIWPDKKQLLNNTGVVIAFVAICSVLIAGMDALFSFAIKLLLKSA